ncbi:MAG TPA: hypothetical protein GXX18_19310 [Bacillales bacterium]|nr:hypothetical protein [Bacillales bacterium]
MSEQGYEIQKGRTYTPSIEDQRWLDDFNDLLKSQGISRNALTSKCLEIGVRYLKNGYAEDNNGLYLGLNNLRLTRSEIDFLKSEQGQKVIGNIMIYKDKNSRE